jgi:hypothetical protein
LIEASEIRKSWGEADHVHPVIDSGMYIDYFLYRKAGMLGDAGEVGTILAAVYDG